MNNRNLYIGLIFLLLTSCSYVKNSDDYLPIIKGKWKMNRELKRYEVFYIMSDSSCVLLSIADTIYRYKFKVIDGNFIIDDNGKKNEYKILYMNENKIIFYSFFDFSFFPTYYKVPNDDSNY